MRTIRMILAALVLALGVGLVAPAVAPPELPVVGAAVAEADACRPSGWSHGSIYYWCHGVLHRAIFSVHYDILWYNQDVMKVYHIINGFYYYQGTVLTIH